MQNPTNNLSAYAGMKLNIPAVELHGTGYMLNERVKYAAVNGQAILSTANANLDGTGTLVDLITGAGSGTMIRRIIIKAQGSTTQGMIRIFFKAGVTNWIFREIEVPAITQSAKQDTFMAVLDEPFFLKASYSLRASTEKAETFIVSAEGMQLSYPA